MTTNYCPELHQQLVELVGEDGLKLEPISSTYIGEVEGVDR